MTESEREQLNRFLQLLAQAKADVKDAEAEALIRDAVARQPDAGYLLVQRVMQLEHALLEATQKPGFPGDANAWGRTPVAPQAPRGAQLDPVQMQQSPPRPSQPSAAPGPWGAGLLGTVASTAAGVVAGSFLAQGIGSLFGSHAKDHPAAADAGAIPPGGGTLVETDYGAGSGKVDTADGSIADDFDPGDTGDAA